MGDPGPLMGRRRVPPEERLNIFALVIYIPGELGRFLDDLRRELVPHYNPNAHVSVLPPRSLACDWEAASKQARAVTEAWPAFDIELTDIEVFPITEVLYLEVGEGGAELHRMHAAMNAGALEFKDQFAYHPHVTLAQDLPHDRVADAGELAKRRWRDYRGSRRMRVDRAVFVQNTLGDQWIDLAEYRLSNKS